MPTVMVTDASFKQDVLEASEPVVVVFWAEGCVSCQAISPALEEISSEMQGRVKIAKLNVDENPGIVSEYGIAGVPTLMIFKDGKLVSQKFGALSKGALLRWIQSASA
ncbi:thioredoxin [Methylobacterium nodulans]|uniref:Thioredoxin n=1 Tax=Methylobacterium nodulans (strain LMG 21967 / CNCM I-2342 / ORS 2060) TaxID=460265 RepID=B8ISJ1_METNO|nr:thioredoxin [Methylobacterium nodulans]ACL58831.1 thioredoxin [Methylobacterium nodulans ORS 2060]